ncbi:MFS transporter [Pseudoalteromonas sp. T1lg65]|uniref:MFS transporter n=1 Tax=Pseudoalteromonas sp. T1lg65 TaxID=2077101 RepID=UPI003F7961A2
MPIFHLLLCSMFIFFVLYAPQPLLAEFADMFEISASQSGLLMSVTMLPLAIAPICYGIFLAQRNMLTTLKWVMIALACSCVLFPHMPTFTALLTLRLLQGLLLPAALTSMTGFVGQTFSGSQLKHKMSMYIGSTIAGGYLGRTLAANFATLLDWQSFYYFNALGLLVLALLINTNSGIANSKTNTSISSYLKPLRQSDLLKLYCSVFCMFFCFSGLLNFLPFVLKHDFGIQSPTQVGWVYTGYLLGAIAALFIPFVQKRVRSTWQLLWLLFAGYALSLLTMQSANLSLFIVLFTLICACMFMIHATAAPFSNTLSNAASTVTNGAYVSFYYTGGVLGTYLPGLVYERTGFTGFIVTLTSVCAIGLGLCLHSRSLEKQVIEKVQ